MQNVSEYEIADYVNTLGDHLMHLHLNDNDGTKDQLHHLKVAISILKVY